MMITEISSIKDLKQIVNRLFKRMIVKIIIIIITVYISAEGEIILQFANNAHIMFIGPA